MRKRRKDYKIYRLADLRYSPEDTNYVRYVGKTSKRLNARLSGHLSDSKHCHGEWKAWLAELAADGKKPDIQLIEIVQWDDSPGSHEQYWVEYHEKIGYDLLNVALTGGEGILITEEIEDPIQARKLLAERVDRDTYEARARTKRIKLARKLRIDFGEETIY